MPFRVAAILMILTPMSAYSQTSDEAVREAVKLLRSREKQMIDDTEVAKLRTAIRALEKYGPKTPDPIPVLIPVAKDTPVDKLNKRLAGKLSANRAGEYVLAYDFTTRQHLNDFEVGIKRIAVVNSMLAIEAGDELRHKARWKSFVCASGMKVATTNGAAIGTSNGTWFTPEHTPRNGEPHVGSLHIDVLPPRRTSRSFGVVAHTGKVPMLVSINREKLAIRVGQAILHESNNKPNDVNQIILRGGPDGASFSELEITGELDPDWIAATLKEEPEKLNEEPGRPKPANQAKPKDTVQFQGHSYALIKEPATWHLAKQRCEEMGGHLVCVTSQQEESFVEKLCGNNLVWIGATDEAEEGKWVNVDGTTPIFSNIILDNAQQLEHWICFDGINLRKFNDWFSGGRLPYLCEWDR